MISKTAFCPKEAVSLAYKRTQALCAILQREGQQAISRELTTDNSLARRCIGPSIMAGFAVKTVLVALVCVVCLYHGGNAMSAAFIQKQLTFTNCGRQYFNSTLRLLNHQGHRSYSLSPPPPFLSPSSTSSLPSPFLLLAILQELETAFFK